MTDALGRRCALVLLAALTLATLVGLLAWGPVPLDAGVHHYADQRRWLGLPNAGNVLANLPLLLVGLWGWRVTQASGWPAPLRQAWAGFHACVVGGSAIASVYHVAPTTAGYVLAQMAMSAAFVLLTLGMLAERVHAGFAARPGATAAALVGAATLAALVSGSAADGAVDLRPFLLLQLIPVLLIPAGALSLPGTHTRPSDWLFMLVAYAAAQGFDLADAPIHAATGWLGGHALMHLALAGVAARLAYRAASAGTVVDDIGTTRAQTSLNTAS